MRHIAARRFAILRITQTIPKAEFEAAHCRSPCLTTVGKGDILSLYQTVDRE